MDGEVRKTGIEGVGDMPWGTHLCQFYQSKQDLLETLVPYFKTGLENNEFCMWVTARPLTAREAYRAMAKAISGFTQYLAKGQIEILSHDEWYLKDGFFDLERVLNGWVDKLNGALARGYDGLRLTGNTAWLEKKDWQNFTEYEAKINSVIGRYRMLALCSYWLDQCSASGVIDVVRNHQFALMKRAGAWEMIESAIYQQTNEALRQSEERFRMIYEDSPIGIELYDGEGRLVGANKSCLEMFGVSDVSTMKEFQLFEDPNITPEVKQRLRKGEIVTYETAFDFEKVKQAGLYETTKSGVIYLDMVIKPLGLDTSLSLSNYLVQVVDITDRKRAEEALVREKDLLQTVIENTHAMLAYFDPDFNFVRVNSAYASGSGYSEEELIGKNHFELFPNEENERIFKQVRDTGEAVTFCDKPFEYKDQPWRGVTYWDWTLTPIKDACGHVQGLVLSLIDTTRRKKLDELKDEFIGMVSHELRTPLTVIMGCLNTILSEKTRLSPAEVEQLLQDASSETESLAHLLGNLLELSRFQAGQLSLYMEPARIDLIACEVIERIKRQTLKHRFSTDFSDSLTSLNADPLRLERILYNLVENAVKYSPKGGEVKVFARQEKNNLVVGVVDQGIGMSDHDQARIFGPFQRVEHGILQGRGIGLGLLVCRRLVEAHGGKIWVESKPGCGSTFFFTLPLK